MPDDNRIRDYGYRKRTVVYFAGKIGQNDWRHRLIPPLRGTLIPGEQDLFNPDLVIPCPNEGGVGFDYGGPFFVSCDHGCFHGPHSHGVGIVSNEGADDAIPQNDLAVRRQMIFAVNSQRLQRADQVFAYLESADCYGTLIELGMAAAHRIPITIGFSPAINLAMRDDLWMAAAASARVCFGSAEDCFDEFLRDLPEKTPEPIKFIGWNVVVECVECGLEHRVKRGQSQCPRCGKLNELH